MNIGIIGLGLIGGTIAKSLKNNHVISAFDISKDSLSYALNHKIIHRAYDNVEIFLKENKIIYICLYPSDIIRFFNQYESIIQKNTVFIEISGLKKYMIENLKQKISNDFDIIFTHPVAGREKQGVFYSDENIFTDANYVITPVEQNSQKNIELAIRLAKEMKFKNISKITPEEHDDIIAYTSQLTHIISLSLVSSLDTNLNTIDFIGDSYRDLTRISEINEVLWSELFLNNKEHLLDKIRKFKFELEKFENSLEKTDEKQLKDLMIKSRKIKDSIKKD